MTCHKKLTMAPALHLLSDIAAWLVIERIIATHPTVEFFVCACGFSPIGLQVCLWISSTFEQQTRRDTVVSRVLRLADRFQRLDACERAGICSFGRLRPLPLNPIHPPVRLVPAR